MYRKKPIIIFVPDYDDKFLYELYDDDYLNIIIINKIEYYILNNFHLDKQLKILYEQFNLIGKNNINKLIKYLKYLP